MSSGPAAQGNGGVAGTRRIRSSSFAPRTRLIALFAVAVLPLATLAPVWPAALALAGAAALAVLMVACADAVLGARRLAELRVEAPDVVRLQKGRTGTFEIVFHQEPARARLIEFGCILPTTFSSEAEIQNIRLPGEANVAKAAWTTTPAERGLYPLELIAIEGRSPLGLWARRERHEVSSEIRVYPDLLAERQRVAALFLRRGFAGSHAQRKAGQGREFEKLRDYVRGDSLGDVHWRASARRRHLVTKLHQVERSHEVYVVIDASRLSARELPVEGASPSAPSHVTALDRCVTAALILGAAAERQGDQFGLIAFSDRILTFLRARAGQGHFDTCREKLYTLQPQAVTPDFEELCSFIRARINKRALMVFLTALDDPFLAESFVEASALIARQHLILVNMLRPAGVRPVFENTDVHGMEDLYRELGGHLQWEKLRALEGVLRQRGMRFGLLDPLNISAELVKQHGDVRARDLI
jgi:uncharacterized protein (DUF58 family)